MPQVLAKTVIGDGMGLFIFWIRWILHHVSVGVTATFAIPH